MNKKTITFFKTVFAAALIALSASVFSGCGEAAEDIEVPLSSQYIYNSMRGNERIAFKRIYAGVSDFKYKIKLNNITQNELDNVHKKFYLCGSEFFYLSGALRYQLNGDGVIPVCYMNYDYYENSAKKMREQLEEKENEILSKITPDMSDADKLYYIHNYLIDNVTYDAEATDSDNVFGALIKHRTHCQGFSKSVCCLCDKLGIQSMLAVGEAGGGGHMWNMVKVDGIWYNLDVTWDDPDHGGHKLTYYFLISDDTISQTHVKDYSYVSYPEASLDYNYRKS